MPALHSPKSTGYESVTEVLEMQWRPFQASLLPALYSIYRELNWEQRKVLFSEKSRRKNL